ncbi:MAG: acyl-CoA dehydrogenase family protein [Gammaproteobacteria bacterium]
MIPRTLYSAEHEQFRDSVRRFVEREIVPQHARWEHEGIVPRETWLAAGAAGLLLCSVPEEYGGMGGDFLHSCVVIEELARVGASGPGFGLHSEIVAPYILRYGSEAQKRELLPAMARGEIVGAIAMTEPGAGSDLQGIRTRAVRDGDDLIVNGSKIFITNGQNADVVITVARTDPDAGHKGISLVLVRRGDPGFERGRNLEKIGWKAQDTSELFFNDVRVPAGRILGEAGRGFRYLMEQLGQERLTACVRGAAVLESILEQTVRYTKERQAFGQPLFEQQNTRFKLADAKTRAVVCRTFVDRCVELHMQGTLDSTLAAMAKMYVTDLVCEVLDDLLQMHGGYGFMWEYPVARAWADNRVTRIAGGTSEIMKEIISRAL